MPTSEPRTLAPDAGGSAGLVAALATLARAALRAESATVVLLEEEGARVAGAEPSGAGSPDDVACARAAVADGAPVEARPGVLAAPVDAGLAPGDGRAAALVVRGARAEGAGALLGELAAGAGPLVAGARRLDAAAWRGRAHETVLNAASGGVCGLDPSGRIDEVNPAAARMLRRAPEELVGADLHDLVHPAGPGGRPCLRERCPLQAAIGAGRRHAAPHEVFWRADGSSFPVEYTIAPLREGEDLRGGVIVFRDIGPRLRADRELREAQAENRRLAGDHAALRRVAITVATQDDPSRVLDLVAAEVAALLNVDAGLVVRFEEDEATTLAWWGARHSDTRASFPLEGNGAIAGVHRTGKPARVDDYRALDGDAAAMIAGASGYRGSVAAPVRVGGHVWGAVLASTSRPQPIPPHAESRLAQFAELVGVAIANADDRARLAARASEDSVTGLANHRAFHERLRDEVARAQRHGRDLSLVLLDLDHFKQVNDAYGHQTGDQVLAEVGRRLAGVSRAEDMVARVGGEEFGWILPEADAMRAYAAAERAREAVAGAPFPPVGRITISAGVCELAQASGANGLFRLADGALYWAKRQGRNVTYLYSPEVVEVLSADERSEQLERERVLASLRALARAIDAKDSSTQSHSERVGAIAQRLALANGWSEERAAELREAGIVHDVGKIGVPDAVLLKPGRLEPEEYEQVKEHAERGATIVSEVLNDEQVSWVRYHHERWDGQGYPDGLRGEEIPDGARILAVADAWDVMVSERAYQRRRSPSQALRECKRSAGTHLCPDVVATLIRLHDEEIAAAEGEGGPRATRDLLTRRS